MKLFTFANLIKLIIELVAVFIFIFILEINSVKFLAFVNHKKINVYN